MEVYCNGLARIKHKQSGIIYEIEPDELEWDCVGGDDRKMGPELHYEATLEHDELGPISWSLYEYPVGVENYQTAELGGHELIHDFEYGLRHTPEPYDWIDYDTPSNPFDIFMDSYHHTGDILADHGGAAGDHLINRMVFSQQVSALEAYLADTLINEVLGNKAAIINLLAIDKNLKSQKYDLTTIYTDPNLVETAVRKYLKEILYHNLEKVDYLYNCALGIKIIDPNADNTVLFKSITYRHDCVHRNGFDSSGKKLDIFTKQYVQGIADLMKALVESIEKNLQAASLLQR